MGSDHVVCHGKGNGSETKRKTPLQIQALERFYSEQSYPSQSSMEDLATTLNLTYKQVRGWFIEKRRKHKRGRLHPHPSYTALTTTERIITLCTGRDTSSKCIGQLETLSSYNTRRGLRKNHKEKQWKVTPLQRIAPPDYILQKVFRKDGPPLGVKFDVLPRGAFRFSTSTGQNPRSTCTSNRKGPKRRKVLKSPIIDSQVCTKESVPVRKHGMGKGLMTVWRATNPRAGSFPSAVNFIGREPTDVHHNPRVGESPGPLQRKVKRPQHHVLVKNRQRRLGKKVPDKRKCAIKTKKVQSNKAENTKKTDQAECKLALEEPTPIESSNVLIPLVDDEELELRELQAGPNPLTCSAHIASRGMHGCPLCKDLLARFPPYSVKMKNPLSMQPWGSSPELVKKIFKVFRFLYSHATTIDMCPFTLDDFAQAFHDKDSLLLGKIHMSLLKLLLVDVEMELSCGYLPHASKDHRYLAFVHAVKREQFILKRWTRSLNALTWTEILRQVLVAAGFSSKKSTFRKDLNQEESRMAEYGLCPGTLKGELFSILSKQGNGGLKVSELARMFWVVELHPRKTTEELELLITSTLSSDITLFEKISPSAYRLRINPLVSKGGGDLHSDGETSGSVDDESESITDSSSDESEMASEDSSLRLIKHKQHHKASIKCDMLVEYTEIDESNSGEVWALGLMEGEYSELSIEEKLDVLVALADLTSAVSSIRIEDPQRVPTESVPSIQHHGGAKIKRSISVLPFKSFAPLKRCRKESVSKKKIDFTVPEGSKGNDTDIIEEVEFSGHPLTSICLGSDRRYNSYWLFLGPCSEKDAGHRRIYFESSEDGHWEVIDSEEALCALLSVLDARGMREARLLASLEKRETFLCKAMSADITTDNGKQQSTSCDQSSVDIVSSDGSSPTSEVDNNLSLSQTVNNSLSASSAIVLELGRNAEEQKRKWDRLQAFDAWLWKSFYSNLYSVKLSKRSYLDSLSRCATCHDLYWRDEKHCRICHATFELDFDLEERYAIHVATCREKEGNDICPKHKVLSSQLQSLKAALHAIESAMPKEALVSAWTMSDHKLWVMRLRRTSCLLELLQVLTDFVGAINEDWLRQCSSDLGSNLDLDDIIVFFPALPQTTSAVGLWLVKLDALIAPYLQKS